jgi:adenylate cyclase
MVTNSEVNEPLDKLTSENDLPGKATSDDNYKSRLRSRLQFIGGALASVAAVGAVAGGLIGYWTVWKTVRTEVFREGQETQRTKPSRNAGGQST